MGWIVMVRRKKGHAYTHAPEYSKWQFRTRCARQSNMALSAEKDGAEVFLDRSEADAEALWWMTPKESEWEAKVAPTKVKE